MKKVLTTLLILITFQAFSQNKSTYFNAVEATFFYGKPIEHDKSLRTAIQGNAVGFLLSYNTVSKKINEFDNLYNNPVRGYSLLYENFNSTILGEVYAGFRHFTYNLTPKKKLPLLFTSGFGLAYATTPFNSITNNQNFAFGSHILVSAFINFKYQFEIIQDKLQIATGINLTHFSNMSFKDPNLGINTVAFNVGVNYNLSPIKVTSAPNEKSLFKKPEKWHYNLILRGGYNESLIVGSGMFPFYTVTAYAEKKINNYSTLTGGIDFFNSKYLRNYIKNITIEEGKNYNINDYKRIGIFIGHELTQNNYAFISQIGYTIYYPFPYVSRVYERFGFKYKLSNHLFSEMSLKVNLFRAEGFEVGIGYRI